LLLPLVTPSTGSADDPCGRSRAAAADDHHPGAAVLAAGGGRDGGCEEDEEEEDGEGAGCCWLPSCSCTTDGSTRLV
jgi:hypothetical protein